ncbi:hypothetical protein QF117_13080 [Vibrio sp. YMD68]|nr:hypothetical protein [Vibrio sp. YMD68]WGW01705.1 hypothetical protein QF117_13080 [Vibrio sp. YMD68]
MARSKQPVVASLLLKYLLLKYLWQDEAERSAKWGKEDAQYHT